MARKLIKRLGKQQAALIMKADVTALYMRVSTDLQATEGNSLEAQREKLQAHCASKGWPVINEHIYIDAGISGKSTDERDAFNTMLKAAADGEINRIVVTKRDRFARNTIDFLTKLDELCNIGCALVCLDFDFDSSTPTGRLISTVFASFAEWEASLITERVMSGKVQNASKGGYNGAQCPLGYDYDNGAFTPNEQAGTIKIIFDMFQDDSSLSEISSHLNATGVPTAKGGMWYPATVRYILLNGFYAGISQWGGQADQIGAHPAIISQETYRAVSHRLDNMKRGGPQGDPSKRIAQILRVLEILRTNHSSGQTLQDIEELRIIADKTVQAELNLKSIHTVQSKYSVQLWPEVKGAQDFDRLAYDWLHNGSMKLYDILIKHSIKDADLHKIEDLFKKQTALKNN